MSEATAAAHVLPDGGDHSRLGLGLCAGLAAGALWGMVFVAPRVVDGFSSVDYTIGRYLVCGAFSLVVLFGMWVKSRVTDGKQRAQLFPNWRQAGVALGLSVLGYTGYYLALAFAIEHAGSVLPTLIIGTIPVWMMILGKPSHLRWGSLLPGLALTGAGLCVMVWSQAAHMPEDEAGSGILWLGLALAGLAMASWTAFGLLNAVVLKREPHVHSSDWANWMGVAAGLGACALWSVHGSQLSDLMQRDGWLAFVWICVITGVGAAWVASVLWNVASRHLSPSLAGQLIVSETVFGVMYSFAWDGQWPALSQWVACALFVLGILASIRAHR